MATEMKYMHRALQLAKLAEGNTSPNPMVGAVIVTPDGKKIGEGYHRRCGEGHAEVNAIASVKNPEDLKSATMYVTLEPCSHYGKTPPCAKLIIDKGIKRVVVGSLDPFEKVSGRGVAMLREAGVEVEIADEETQKQCKNLNRKFMTAHTTRRPFITLKWAQSADGFMDAKRTPAHPDAARFSTSLTSLIVHKLRSEHDAIMVGSGTVLADNPRLNVRNWDGKNPLKVVIDRRSRIDDDAAFMQSGDYKIYHQGELDEILNDLYSQGVTSLLVEGGASLLQSFLDLGLWDEARVETSPVTLGESGSIVAPSISMSPIVTCTIDGNRIDTYRK